MKKPKTKKKKSSARPLHKRIVLHPISILLVLLTGVIISGITVTTEADGYTVTGTVAAAPLTQPAIITSPVNGSSTETSPSTITGSCPDGSYVVLTRNGSYSGTANCVSNQFQILTDLSDGSNILQAQDYNITNQPGPVSTPISISYSAPAPPPNNPSTPINPTSAQAQPTYEAQNSPTAKPSGNYDNSGHGALILATTIKYGYVTTTTGQQVQWDLSVNGGTAPYVLTVQWGDNSSSALIFKSSGDFTIQHTYSTAGNYNIIVSAIDSLGERAILQLTVNVKPSATPLVIGNTNKNGISGPSIVSRIHKYLWVLWPTYAVVTLMVFSFWLGERQVYLNLVKRRPKPALRHR